jgi:hypothetical protein
MDASLETFGENTRIQYSQKRVKVKNEVKSSLLVSHPAIHCCLCALLHTEEATH